MNADYQQPIAWIAFERKDGTEKLEHGCTASNPTYVLRHKEWNWLPLVFPPGVRK